MATGYLQTAAASLASLVTGLGGVKYDSPIKEALKAALKPIKAVVHALTDSERLQAVILIALSGVLIYIALMLLVRVMRQAMHSRVEVIVTRGLHKAPLFAILVGMLVTVMVQSSSITTSLLVPLAGAGLITLAQAFPITIGANVGTTITALLAALAVTGPNAQAGIVIALVHLLFNMSATLLIYPVERVRNLPLKAATRLADVAVESRRWAFFYVVILFYGLPTLLIVLNKLLG
jgi:sodium-dependent phosphate cotransporter